MSRRATSYCGQSDAGVTDGNTLLILFTERLDVRLTVRIEKFLAALPPRLFELRPVRPAFLGDGTQVLTELFQGGPPEEPVAIVDLINDKAGLEDDRVGDHRIVERIGIFGDVEIFLDLAPSVGEERPVGTGSAAKFIRLSDIVRADRDKPAIANLHLTMEFNKPFSLPPILGAETSAAEDKNHWMLSLQFGELSAFRCVVGKLIIGEDSPRNHVRSHVESARCRLLSFSPSSALRGMLPRAASSPIDGTCFQASSGEDRTIGTGSVPSR